MTPRNVIIIGPEDFLRQGTLSSVPHSCSMSAALTAEVCLTL